MSTREVVQRAVTGLTVTEWTGASPVVLALPGLTSSASVYAPLAAALPDARFLAPDLRGRGDGVGATGPTGLRAHAQDVVSVLDELDLTDVVLIGHSMGAYLAPLVALHAGARLQRLVLIDGGLPPDLPFFMGRRLTRLAFGASLRSQDKDWPSIEAHAQKAKLDNMVSLRPELRDVVREMLYGDVVTTAAGHRPRLDVKRCAADAVDTFFGTDPLDVLAGVEVPVHAVLATSGRWDGKRPLISDSGVAAAQGRVPGLRVTRAAGNHVTVLFAPELTAAITGSGGR